MNQLLEDLSEFCRLWWNFVSRHVRTSFFGFENFKAHFAEALYRQRGKLARPFIHSGMFSLTVLGIMLGPVIADNLPQNNVWQIHPAASVLSATTEVATSISEKGRADIFEYTVQKGDTLSSIADKFGISQETIIWQNHLSKRSILKPGQKLQILPVTGVAYKVQRGDTIYSIAKKYSAEPQAIVDFPFNTFVNDETFALAVGQIIIVPDGKPPAVAPGSSAIVRLTPDAGTVSASGQFIWPTSGRISQGFVWYHKAIDIANKSTPNVLAADSGKILVAGWPDRVGYGNRVIIDHGNGYVTLYAHLAQIYVVAGQTVKRGDVIGKMGSTGRSTGTHLHFEVRKNGVNINPLHVLK